MVNWSEEFLGQFETRLHFHLSSCAPKLSELMLYQFYPAGKRIRPLMIASLLSDLTESDDLSAKITDTCCAIEILHTASLIHDDLPCLDNDSERRGRPTLHIVAGEAKALLIGDLLISKAFSICSFNSALDSETNNKITELFSDSFCQVCEGQIIDQENSCKTEQQVLDYYYLKTGALFYACIEAARLVASEHLEAESLNSSLDFLKLPLKLLARQIGIAFQVKNDLLEVDGGSKRSTDKDNDRKTIFSVRGLDDRYQFVDSLEKQIWDTFTDIEKQFSLNRLSKTRELTARIFKP